MQPTAAASLDAARVLGKVLLRAAGRLGLSHKEFSRTLGTSAALLSRLAHGQRVINPASKQGELALLVRVFRSADALLGGDDSVRAWLRAPNTHLGGLPVERMQRVEGLVDVASYPGHHARQALTSTHVSSTVAEGQLPGPAV